MTGGVGINVDPLVQRTGSGGGGPRIHRLFFGFWVVWGMFFGVCGVTRHRDLGKV